MTHRPGSHRPAVSIGIFSTSLGICLILLVTCLLSPRWAQAAPNFRQPAYITNAYFSDKIEEEENKGVRPLAVVKALRSRSSGVLGYLILDLVLIKEGLHHFKVSIINPQGDKVTDLTYPPVEKKGGTPYPLYTAAAAASGNFPPGIWFFKVWDRVNDGTWFALDTFSVMVIDPDKAHSPASKGD